MRKLLLLLLLVTASVSAQTEQFRKVYTHVVIVKNNVTGEWHDAENVLIYNYGDKGRIKFYFSDNSVETFVQVSAIEKGATKSGYTYQGANYLNESGSNIYIQLFDSEESGVRLIYESGDSIQLAP